jgi:hypothetical protein
VHAHPAPDCLADASRYLTIYADKYAEGLATTIAGSELVFNAKNLNRGSELWSEALVSLGAANDALHADSC